MAERYLIVNADDFGQSPGINRGVVEAHERGIVTSASLMVRWPSTMAAAAYARDHPSLSLGLHVDFGEWAYRDEIWVPVYEVAPLDDPATVAAEAARQLAAFRRLVGRDPTHLDSHQHVHRAEPLLSVLLETARALDVPLRQHSPDIRNSGEFYGQSGKGEPYPEAISLEWLLNLLRALPPGITELGCHPGVGQDLDTMYRAERARELEVLCDPRVRAAIVAEGIELRSFANLTDRA